MRDLFNRGDGLVDQRATPTYLTSCYHYLSAPRQIGAWLAALTSALILNRLANLQAMSLSPRENKIVTPYTKTT